MAKRRSRSKKGKCIPTEIPTWALLVYIAADNDLSDAGLRDIEEMCNEGSSEDLHVGVEIDTYGEHTGSIRYEITKPDPFYHGKGHRTVIERLSEKDTGDPKVLKDFLKWGLKRYPAKNRLLVVGGHGLGFRSSTHDFAQDDFGSSLDMPEMEGALRGAGIKGKNRIQILGFDACLMNMVEIAHHFASQAEIIVGSQQTEPGEGWPYDKVMELAKDKKIATGPEKLAKGIVEEYKKDYKRRRTKNVTQSAVRTDKTKDVIKALDIFGKALLNEFDHIKTKLHTIRAKTQTFYMADYIDLIHFSQQICKHLKDYPSIVKAASDVEDKAKKSIIFADKYPGSKRGVLKNANGLSVWFPDSDRIYLKNRRRYMKLHCNDRKFGWKSFLDRYYR